MKKRKSIEGSRKFGGNAHIVIKKCANIPIPRVLNYIKIMGRQLFES